MYKSPEVLSIEQQLEWIEEDLKNVLQEIEEHCPDCTEWKNEVLNAITAVQKAK